MHVVVDYSIVVGDIQKTKSAFIGILLVHDIYYEMLQLLSNLPTLPLYLDGWCLYNQYMNTKIISNSTSLTFKL